jgi:hypothetical protein
VQAFNPRYSEEEIGWIAVQGQPGKNILKTPCQPIVKQGGVGLSSQLCRKAQIRRIMSTPGHKEGPYLKNS